MDGASATMEKNESQEWVDSEADRVELIKSKGKPEVCAGVLHFVVLLTVSLLMVALLLLEPVVLRRLEQSPAAGAACAREPVLVCYYGTPGAAPALQPADIAPRLCTHINVAFARVRDRALSLDPAQLRALRQVVRLKEKNPDLKVLLSVGGAGGDNGFSEMVADHASRKVFIKSIKSILRNYSLDGIDLDWEFPAVHEFQTKKKRAGRERQHFSQLLREIRAEYVREKRNYLLTVAAAAPEIIVDAAYDVDQLNLYTDFVNIMTYDYHFYSKMTPFTGFNSPLFAEPKEQLYLSTLNINYTVHMYLARGLSPDKVVVGVPTYGHSFRLVNERNAAPGAPAAGVGALGARGFVDYPAVCATARRPAARVARDTAAAVPYLAFGADWLSFDDERSVARKAAFITELGLRGAMIYSLNADDYRGECAAGGPGEAGGPFPLVTTIKRALHDSACRVA